MSNVDSTGEATRLQDSYTEMSEILMPNHTNNLGRALGGSILHWMDICGAIAARRYSRQQVVTASMDHVDFTAAIDLGDIVTIMAYVFDTGATSVDVKVEVHAERPSDGESNQAAHSFFTFVALDSAENPTQVPALRCPTASETELRDTALEERDARHHDRASAVEH